MKSRGLPAALLIVVAACSGENEPAQVTSGSLDFPPPPSASATTTSRADFAGADACRACHQDQYDAWKGSTHGRAGGSAGPDVVIAAFDGSPIRFLDATVIPRIRGGVYEFVVRQDDFDEEVFTVDGVIGGAHMIGGGTQGFISRVADGTERFLPWDWSGDSGDWFCNTGSRTNQGWRPITPRMSLADCGDWPPIRPLGTVDRFANCQECHGSQITTMLDPGIGYLTEYTTLQVNCESCHGPGARHVELAEAGFPRAEAGIESLANLDKDEALAVCFQCHALKDVLREGYLPSESLETYYALKYPMLGDQPYFADGRVRSFAYQANHLASACYLEGPMDCASCHEPHAQEYWDINRTILDDPLDDRQCTSCHQSKATDVADHTFHPEGTEASKCVSCHMPYLQHQEVGDDIPFARSDHTIAIPRPVFDAGLGLETACAQCHQDLSPLQLESQARAWWGEIKPHRPVVEGIYTEFRARNMAEAADLLLHPEETDPLAQFQAMSRLLTGYLQPNAGSLPPAVEADLLAFLENPDLDLRSLAASSLHWSVGDDPDVRGRLVELLERTQSDEALRGRWLLALGFLGDRARDADDFETSAIAYEKALELSPGDPRVLHALGQMHNRAGSFDKAIMSIRASLAVDPQQPLAWVNLGIALSGSGDQGSAREAYQEALNLNPREALAHFNLGNSLQAAQRYDEAAEAYRQAVAADRGLGRGHFELARTLIRLERYAEALPHARRAVEFMPNHVNSRQMLADLERSLGGAP